MKMCLEKARLYLARERKGMLNASPACTSQGNNTPRDEPLPEQDCVGQEDEENEQAHNLQGRKMWNTGLVCICSYSSIWIVRVRGAESPA